MPSPDQLLTDARRALAENRIDIARECIGRALGRAPQRVDLLAAKAFIELAGGDATGAARTCRQVLARQPTHVPMLNLLGEALAASDPAAAEAAWRRALAADPRNAEAWFHLGNLFGERGLGDAAIDAYRHSLRSAPNTPSVLTNLGRELDRAGDVAEAERCYRDVLANYPNQVETLANLAALLFRTRRFDAALPLYERIVALDPRASAEVWNNLGVCQRYGWNNGAALESFRRAALLAPDAPEVLANVGFAECERGRYAEARRYLEKAHALQPARRQILAHLFDIELQFADWSQYERHRAELIAAVESMTGHENDAVAPFAFMSVCDDPRLQLLAARSFAWPSEPVTGLPTAPPSTDGRVRLGFVSTVFHEHPVPRLLVDLFARLDRSRFDIFCYLVAAGAHDEMRERIASMVSGFRDVRGESVADIVAAIRTDGIDMLFDVAGHTEYARPDVFAARAAPIQVNYLGQAGTMGADYYDYIVTDPWTTPPEDQACYAERFWMIGDCYFPCDPVRSIAEPAPLRSEYGLPEQAFVFMSQAAAHKISPAIFDTWMRVLTRIENGVLWLRPVLPIAQVNLRREAERRGIDPARLHFAPKEPLPRYLARFRLANLYLDSHPFGTHTTVNDALYAGLPVVTRLGRSVAGRASATQLRAAGLPELIVDDDEAYEALAVTLAQESVRLQALTARLRGPARASALFDMESYAQRFEHGATELWQAHAAASGR